MTEAEAGDDDGINDELAKLTERKLKTRRRAVLVSTAVIFTLTAILLFISLAQIHGYQVTPALPSPPLTSPHMVVRNWTVRRLTQSAWLSSVRRAGITISLNNAVIYQKVRRLGNSFLLEISIRNLMNGFIVY